MSLLPDVEILKEREQWLEEMSAREGDVMIDDEGKEYIMTRTEHEYPYESTYTRVELPEKFQNK